MLVLTFDKEVLADGSGVQHSIKRYVERVGGFWGQVRYGDDISKGDVKKLLSVIQEINLYLPDDWRMTRSKNNFRVFVQIDGKSALESFVLAGRSFRQANGDILHVVDTVLKPEYLDNTDRETLVAKGDINALPKSKRSEVYERLRMDHPELVRPNLYFIKPRLDDCPGPLFARQYERAFKDDPLYEFHRIHPLTKNGVDGGKFRWIRWTCFGEATLVKSPHCNSHGRDYWNVPQIGFEKATRIVQEHKRLLEKHEVTMLEGEHSDDPYEVEYKLLYSGDPSARQSVFEAAEQLIKRSGLSIDSRKTHVQNDTYVDDSDFTILFGGGSFRLRQTPETSILTLKAKRSDNARLDGEYNRLEEQQTITTSEANAFLAGQQIAAPPLKALKQRFPSCGRLAPKAKIETTREILHARNRSGQDAEVCLDFVRFLDLSGKEVGRDVEIEIESKGMPVVQIAKLADLLRKQLDLQPSPQSKYERALEYCPDLLVCAGRR